MLGVGAVLMSVFAVWAASLPAAAAFDVPRMVLDGDDSPGGLDLATARVHEVGFHPGGPRMLRVRIGMYDPWRTETLSDPDTAIWVQFDTNGDDVVERWLSVDTSAGGSLFAEMHDARTSTASEVGSVRRPNARTLQLELPFRLLRTGPRGFRWEVISGFHAAGHPYCGDGGTSGGGTFAIICVDQLPDDDWAIEGDPPWLVRSLRPRS